MDCIRLFYRRNGNEIAYSSLFLGSIISDIDIPYLQQMWDQYNTMQRITKYKEIRLIRLNVELPIF